MQFIKIELAPITRIIRSRALQNLGRQRSLHGNQSIIAQCVPVHLLILRIHAVRLELLEQMCGVLVSVAGIGHEVVDLIAIARA